MGNGTSEITSSSANCLIITLMTELFATETATHILKDDQ